MKFHIRKWKVNDAYHLQSFANNEKIADNLRDTFPHPYTLEDAFWYIDYCNTQNQEKHIFRAIEADNMAIGSISLVLKEVDGKNCAELGYWIGEPYWNKGITTKAVEIMCSFAFQNFNLDYIYAEVFTDNNASIKVLEKAAFIKDKIKFESVKKCSTLKDTYIFFCNKPI